MVATTTLRLRRLIMSQDAYKRIRNAGRIPDMKAELRAMAKQNGWKAWTAVPPINRIGPFVFEFYNPEYEVLE